MQWIFLSHSKLCFKTFIDIRYRYLTLLGPNGKYFSYFIYYFYILKICCEINVLYSVILWKQVWFYIVFGINMHIMHSSICRPKFLEKKWTLYTSKNNIFRNTLKIEIWLQMYDHGHTSHKLLKSNIRSEHELKYYRGIKKKNVSGLILILYTAKRIILWCKFNIH